MTCLYYIAAWLAVVFTSADLLTVWFKSNFIGELMRLFKHTIWRDKDGQFWGENLDTRLRHEWDTWLVIQAADGFLAGWLVRLLTCPVCLGTHMAWIISGLVSLVMVLVWSMDPVTTALFFILASRSTLSAALLISNRASR